MQIILTEDEYNALKAKSNEGVADYQRKFRVALANELLSASHHACGLSINDVSSAIDYAEEIAKRIQ